VDFSRLLSARGVFHAHIFPPRTKLISHYPIRPLFKQVVTSEACVDKFDLSCWRETARRGEAVRALFFLLLVGVGGNDIIQFIYSKVDETSFSRGARE
jgi:hypothetical protein